MKGIILENIKAKFLSVLQNVGAILNKNTTKEENQKSR